MKHLLSFLIIQHCNTKLQNIVKVYAKKIVKFFDVNFLMYLWNMNIEKDYIKLIFDWNSSKRTNKIYPYCTKSPTCQKNH
jgi:hypothetical protein